MSKIQPGKYKAKIEEYGIVTNKKGQPQVKVVFDIFDQGQKYSWFGNLDSEIGKNITTKNLLVLGANQGNIDKVDLGKHSGVLNMEKTFEIVIEDRVFNEKTYTQIKYINDPEAGGKGKQEYVKATGALASLKGTAAALIATGEFEKPTDKPVEAGF